MHLREERCSGLLIRAQNVQVGESTLILEYIWAVLLLAFQLLILFQRPIVVKVYKKYAHEQQKLYIETTQSQFGS